MKIKLTVRYLLMVAISTIFLVTTSFIVLTMLEDNFQNNDSFRPSNFAYNFFEEVEIDESDTVSISEEGKALLLENESWVQILDHEGYAIAGFNEPSYALDHYTPLEIEHKPSYSHRENYYYDIGRINDRLSYIVATPSEGWFRYSIEINQQMIIQFLQIMFMLALLIFVIMGFIFSVKIANPVTQIIHGVEELSRGNYEAEYNEKGLYKSVVVRLKELAKQLKTTEIERNKTKEQREQWVANISHDLKTPLSTIKGYSEIIINPEYAISAEEMDAYLKTIHEKALYMEEMIEELRLNERLMHDGIELKRESNDLVLFLKDIIIDILNHPDYSDRIIVFESSKEEIIYSFDKELLRRCIENIIYNALIHNDHETEVVVSVDIQNEHILIDVKDNGQGLTNEEVEQLFNRYYRGSNTKNYKGTGLGMSIAKEVVAAHNGEIVVKSEVNQGTEIQIIL